MSKSTKSCSECMKAAVSAENIQAPNEELEQAACSDQQQQHQLQLQAGQVGDTSDSVGLTSSPLIEAEGRIEQQQQQQAQSRKASAELTGQRHERPAVVVRESLLFMPAESICAATLAAGAPTKLKEQICAQRKSSATNFADQRHTLAASFASFHTRRKSECHVRDKLASDSLRVSHLTATNASDSNLFEAIERPASACCSFQSLKPPDWTTPAYRATTNKAGAELSCERAQSACSSRKGSAQIQRSPLTATKSACLSNNLSTSRLASASDVESLERQLNALKSKFDRHCLSRSEVSKLVQSYLSYFKQWAEYDPFVVQSIPSNPWIVDSTELWDSERQTKDVHCRRVRRWAFCLKELLNDPAGREQFHRFLEKEFSAENLSFWDAVQELKQVPARDVARRVEAIWAEYLARG